MTNQQTDRQTEFYVRPAVRFTGLTILAGNYTINCRVLSVMHSYTCACLSIFLALLCATAQQGYCHGAGLRCSSSVRPSSSVDRHHFLGKREVDRHQIFVTGTYTHISRPFLLLLFSRVYHFLRFSVFAVINMAPYGRINFKRHLLPKYAPDSLPKFMHTHRDAPYQSCSMNCKILKFEFLPFFFRFR